MSEKLPTWLVWIGKRVATLVAVLIAVVAGLMIWQAYIVAPWTRDGRTRVQVANIAPQVSGQITQIHVVDNQFVRKGDLLYVIDPFDFRTALANARGDLEMRAADLLSKRQQSARRELLTTLSTSIEEKQNIASSAAQAEAMFRSAQASLSQAEINLQRTQVRSPVTGTVTNLQMRVGDYARTGTNNLAVIDAESYWIDGYFEETKMRYVCVGEVAKATLLGYPRPIMGVVDSLGRGISTSDAASSTQGLPSVNPVYTWVRLAQRIPVHIRITEVPIGIPLVAGMTATISLDSPRFQEQGTGLTGVATLVRSWFNRTPHVEPDCNVANPIGSGGAIASLPEPTFVDAPSASAINPTLAPGITVAPGPEATNPATPRAPNLRR